MKKYKEATRHPNDFERRFKKKEMRVLRKVDDERFEKVPTPVETKRPVLNPFSRKIDINL